ADARPQPARVVALSQQAQAAGDLADPAGADERTVLFVVAVHTDELGHRARRRELRHAESQAEERESLREPSSFSLEHAVLHACRRVAREARTLLHPATCGAVGLD